MYRADASGNSAEQSVNWDTAESWDGRGSRIVVTC